ncbi:MAG TPA: sugar phosphate isomerase/epimerase [Spirillospora sp.]|nr:sugar phosphate isomerase/epimerase [Spirillospora sp.]
MNVTAIGVSIGASNGYLSELDGALKYAQESGYELVEIGVSTLNLILNGRLIPDLCQRVQEMLARYDLRCTVHAPNRTNLAYGYDLALDYAVLQACIEFCHAIKADVLVYHSGLQAIEYVRTGVYPLPSLDEMKRGAEREVESLRRIAPFAADHGVTICMENGDPHLWEYEIMRANGKPDSDLPLYHPRLRIPPIVDQVRAVNHPNVAMTLDLAHLFLAAHAVPFDYLEAVSQAAPVTRHIHLNDNFGKLDTGFDDGGVRAPYGEADLHLPPGWGTIPLAEAFSRLDNYEGYIILELKERYAEFFASARETIVKMLNAS